MGKRPGRFSWEATGEPGAERRKKAIATLNLARRRIPGLLVEY